MKKVTLLLLAVLSILNVNAQKKDRTSMGWLKYVQNPAEPLNVEYKTYTVDAEGASGDDYRRDEIINKFKFEGFEKVGSDKEYDLSFFIKEYSLQQGEYERNTMKKTVKKDGVESTVTTYYYSNSFKYKYLLTLKNKGGEVIYETDYSGVKKVIGKDYSSSKSAFEDYKKKMSEEKGSILSEGVSAVVEKVNDKHGFPVKNLSAVGFKIKAKKFNYDEFNASFETLKASVKTSNGNGQDISAFEVDLRNVIAVMEKEIATKEDSKKARMNPKATAAAYYNITMAYIILKDYDAAKVSLAKGRELDKGVGDASYIENLLGKLADRAKIYKEFIAVK